jgi:hypothetical protein
MAGRPLTRERKAAEARATKGSHAGTDYHAALELFKASHPGEWTTKDIMYAARMELQWLGVSKAHSNQRLAYLRLANDCRKQLYAERQLASDAHALIEQHFHGIVDADSE